jgi:hypothetical protein
MEERMMRQLPNAPLAVLMLALAGCLAGAAFSQAPAGTGTKTLPPKRTLTPQGTLTFTPAAPVPGQPTSHPVTTEADSGYGPFHVHIGGGISGVVKDLLIKALGGSTSQDVNRLFPEWQPVHQPKPVPGVIRDHRGPKEVDTPTLQVGRSYQELEGTVTFPVAHVSFEDVGITHISHDFCFKVIPDGGYQNLLSVDTSGKLHQPDIEVEWECGLGQGNSGNPASEPNKRGDSFGFYSAGHRRGAPIWNWPTSGDWVHVDGLWIWDRGHEIETEIHPPRLVAVRRHNPAMVRAPAVPTHFSFGTRVDIFGSGDSSCIWNNRTGQPFFVQKVPMSEKDYTFIIDHKLPRPAAGPPPAKAVLGLPGSGSGLSLAAFFQVKPPLGGVTPFGQPAKLAFRVDKQPGDTYPGEPTIQPFPDGEPGHPTPHVKVTIPWKAQRAPDTAVFARTLYVFWDNDGAHGVGGGFAPKMFQVTLDKLQCMHPRGEYFHIVHTTDKDKGNWRVFVEAGGTWYFLNDVLQAKPLEGGLDQAQANQTFNVGLKFPVLVGPGDSFRVHADGWEADGIDTLFGHLVNQYDQNKDRVEKELNDTLFTLSVYEAGSRDDPIGEVNERFFPGTSDPNGKTFTSSSRGSKTNDDPSGDTDPNDSYRLTFHVNAIPVQ